MSQEEEERRRRKKKKEEERRCILNTIPNLNTAMADGMRRLADAIEGGMSFPFPFLPFHEGLLKIGLAILLNASLQR